MRSAPCACAAKRSASPKTPGVVDERAEEPGRDRHVRGVEVDRPAPGPRGSTACTSGGSAPTSWLRTRTIGEAESARPRAWDHPRPWPDPWSRSRSDVRSPVHRLPQRGAPGAGRRLPGRRTARSSSPRRCARTRSAAGAGCSAPGASATYRQDDSVDVELDDARRAAGRRRAAGDRRDVARVGGLRLLGGHARPRAAELQRAEDRARRGRAVERVEVDARARRREQLGALERRVGDAELGDRLVVASARARARARRPSGMSGAAQLGDPLDLRRGSVIGMMPGMIGTSMPIARARSTKSK